MCRRIITYFLISLFLSTQAFAVQEESFIQKLRKRFFRNKEVASGVKKIVKSPREMTKDELVSAVRSELMSEPDILVFIPELKRGPEKDGRIYFTFYDTRLEDIDKGRLENILARVYTQAAVARTERIKRQDATNAGMTKVIREPTKTIYVPPAPPKIPRSVPQTPPKIPSAVSVKPKIPQAPSAIPKRQY